jgi:hypothetical protein
VLQRIEGLLDGKWVAMAATGVSLLLLLALIATWVRYARLRRILEAGGLYEEPQADAGPGRPAHSEARRPGSGALIERLLPRGVPAFLLLVTALAAASWTLGYVLAPNTQRFLASPEWQFQPLYLAAHLVTLRLFIAVFTRNFAGGAARLDMPPELVKAGFRVILGPAGVLLALVVAVPFCIWDYGYLYSAGYERMGAELGAVDLAMWGIWCVEWFLNAVIWVVLTGFLIMNVRAIGRYRFRDPIEVALSEKHYRPFLQMSSQGATIVLGFAALTAAYIWYTGGAETDYVGLLIVAVLLVAGFVPPWWLINRNVDRSITEEVAALRRSLAGIASGSEPAAGHGDARPPRNLETRLEEALVLLRIQRLEGMRRGLGWTEARAMGVRMLAPAATVAWNLSANFSEAIVKAGQAMRHLLGAVVRLFAG